MERIAKATVRNEPFPHIVVDEIFPRDFYVEMQARTLADESYVPLVETGRVQGNYSPARLCFMIDRQPKASDDSANVAFWTKLLATYNDLEFFEAWLPLFGAYLEAERAARKIEVGDDTLWYGVEMMLMRDKTSYSLGPHRDSPTKALSALFYLPPDDSNPMLGTSLYVPKNKNKAVIPGNHMKRENFECVGTIPYRPNSMLAFPNIAGSVHGVEPVTGATIRRDLLLYDVKFASRKARA